MNIVNRDKRKKLRNRDTTKRKEKIFSKRGTKIFISHSSIDKKFASWLSRLLFCLGVEQDVIFYSSDFRQGVREKISEEVRQALRETSLDIIVLSEEYRQSAYCLNESGIIWFKNKESDTIVVALPQITGYSQAGFIDNDYIHYRLLSENFLDSLVTRLQAVLSKHRLLQREMDIPLYDKLIDELREYRNSLPIVENLNDPTVDEYNKTRMWEDVRKAWAKIQEITYVDATRNQTYQYVFYKDYIRQIQFYPNKDPNLITINSKAIVVIVNLSDHDYEESYSSKFLKKDGGIKTFKEKFFVDGKLYTETHVQMNDRQTNDQQIIDNPYFVHNGPKIIVKAHTICTIKYETQYDIAPKLFFNSKVLPIPCANYIVDANLDASFIEKFKSIYILRCQFIPPSPENLRNGTVPIDRLVETSDKRHLHYESKEGFPAGGGYVLSLSKND